MKVKSFICWFGLILGTVAWAQGATLYVSTSGSDSNPGTSSQPLRTITYAYSLAGPGTTILVAPGTYTDYTSGWGLHFSQSGTASSPIVIQSQVKGGAILDGQFASDRNKGIYLDGSYNVIEGFVIIRAPGTAIFIEGTNNQILNNEIYNNGSVNEGQGVYSDQGTSGNIYESNYIHDNGLAGSNLDHGLYLCGQNEVVANNVVIRNAACGLQVAGYTLVSNMKVYNNVFAWNGTEGIILWMTLNGVDIENNILYENGHYGVGSYAAIGSGVAVDNNLVYGNGYGDYDFAGGGSTVSYSLGSSISSDPGFVNETSSGFDAHLGSGSPGIGAGANFSSVMTTDMAGVARPASGPWDLGTYVYGSSSGTTNSVHTTLSVASGHGMKITWTSVVGKIYSVACKNRLTDPAWTNMSGSISATNTTTSYTDTTAGSAPMRFYMVYATN